MVEDFDRFISLVRSMRSAQKVYFRQRYTENLRNAVELEKKVDIFIREYEREHALPVERKEDIFDKLLRERKNGE